VSDHSPVEVYQQVFLGLPYAWGWECVCGAGGYDLGSEAEADRAVAAHVAAERDGASR
jgi:hypothetical protein